MATMIAAADRIADSLGMSRGPERHTSYADLQQAIVQGLPRPNPDYS
jgi:hypothetical protein